MLIHETHTQTPALFSYYYLVVAVKADRVTLYKTSSPVVHREKVYLLTKTVPNTFYVELCIGVLM